MIAHTSRLALLDLADRLGDLQWEVYVAIRQWPHPHLGPCIAELAFATRRKESSICGRINELRAAGAIEDGPIKLGACGKMVKTYRACVYRAPEPGTKEAHPELFSEI